jgi:hypothetical protein
MANTGSPSLSEKTSCLQQTVSTPDTSSACVFCESSQFPRRLRASSRIRALPAQLPTRPAMRDTRGDSAESFHCARHLLLPCLANASPHWPNCLLCGLGRLALEVPEPRPVALLVEELSHALLASLLLVVEAQGIALGGRPRPTGNGLFKGKIRSAVDAVPPIGDIAAPFKREAPGQSRGFSISAGAGWDQNL